MRGTAGIPRSKTGKERGCKAFIDCDRKSIATRLNVGAQFLFNIIMDAFSIYALSIYIVASVGVLGNILILCVLMQKHMQNTFNKLRAALAVYDLILLGSNLLAQSILLIDKDTYGKVFSYFLWPIRNFTQTASMFMTVAIAIERFIAVKYPHKYKRNQQYRATKYVMSVTIPAMVFNLPKFNELQPDSSGNDNWSKHWGYAPTSMFKHMGYTIYDDLIFKLLIAGLIPLTMLIFFYANIYVKLRENRLKLETSEIKSRVEDKKTSRQENMARLFSGVVFTSIVCNIPEMINQIINLVLRLQYPELIKDPPERVVTAMRVANFFIVLNSAINIIIYSLLAKSFREECKKVFHKMIPKCKCQRNSSPSDDTIVIHTSVPEQKSGTNHALHH